MNLVGVSKATHAAHDAKHVVVASIYADLSSVGAGYGSVGKNKLKGCVVDADMLQVPEGWCSSGRRAKERPLIPVSEHGCGAGRAEPGRSRCPHAQRSGPGR